MKLGFRELTVTDGRETVGLIRQQGSHRFTAVHLATGQKFGPYPNIAEAAQALSTARKAMEKCQ